MNYAANPIKPDLYDVLATAVYLAATELAEVYPQPDTEDSIKKWTGYLLQQAIKKQELMTEEQRFVFRETHFGTQS
jgi:hypothetical protein